MVLRRPRRYTWVRYGIPLVETEVDAWRLALVIETHCANILAREPEDDFERRDWKELLHLMVKHVDRLARWDGAYRLAVESLVAACQRRFGKPPTEEEQSLLWLQEALPELDPEGWEALVGHLPPTWVDTLTRRGVKFPEGWTERNQETYSSGQRRPGRLLRWLKRRVKQAKKMLRER